MASRGPSLTFFFIGLVIFVGVMLLIYDPNFGIYNNLLLANGVAPDSNYTQAFVGNLSQQKNTLNSAGENYSEKGGNSIVTTGLNIVSGIYSTLAIGFDAIGTLVQLPTYFKSVFNGITTMIPGIPDIIIWMIVTSVVIFIASKFIKALRGQIDDV